MRLVELDEYKKIIIEVMRKLDSICREHNIRYMVIGGTLLGAARHEGLIPWDDDIDIGMPREDYDKLAEVIAKEPQHGLNFIRIEENSDTIFPYGKVCDVNTTVSQLNFKEVEGYGAFVDVFPMYHIPDDEAEREKLRKKMLKKLKVLEHSSRTGFLKSKSFVTNCKRLAAHILSRPIGTEKQVRKFNQACIDMNATKTARLGLPWLRMYVNAADFDNLSSLKFEGYEVCAPEDYDGALTRFYGDWRKLPPEEDRVASHNLTCYIKE